MAHRTFIKRNVQSKFSILTVFCRRDLWHIELQARSLRRFCDQREIVDILFIYNEYTERLSAADAARIARACDGLPVRFSHCLDFAPFSESYCPIGWCSQQILKILGARQVRSELCLILDAKNSLVNPLCYSELADVDGAIYTQLGSIDRIKSQFQIVWDNSLSYFHLEPQDFLGQARRPVTPFPIHITLARELVAYIEQREEMTFADFFMKSNPDPLNPVFTEFLLLHAFALQQSANTHARYKHVPPRHVTIFEPSAESPDQFERLMRTAETTQPLFFAVHADAAEIMTDAQWDRVVGYWQAQGLIASRAEIDALRRWQSA